MNDDYYYHLCIIIVIQLLLLCYIIVVPVVVELCSAIRCYLQCKYFNDFCEVLVEQVSYH